MLLLAAACRRTDARPASTDYSPPAMTARFREHVPEHPSAFGGGATTNRDTLVARFVDAVARSDTARLSSMRLTSSEFAWLYYLDSPLAQPPYSLDPDVMWMQTAAQSDRGRGRLLQAAGGRAAAAGGITCKPAADHGALRLHACTLTLHVAEPPRDLTIPLSIVERDGRYKFAGYAGGM